MVEKMKTAEKQGELKIAKTPPPSVGGYRFGNASTHYTQMNLNYKPKWLHRQCMKMFFGLYWFDQK